MPLKLRLVLSQILVVLLCLPVPAMSALNAVSTDGGGTLLNIANGFPLWYEDAGGRKLELCLEQTVTLQSDGTPFLPCLTAEPLLSRPIIFPSNFGAEAAYYSATASGTYVASNGIPGSMLLVMMLEAGFTGGLIIDNTQAVFNRIRIRVEVPVTGTYRVTHPVGTFDYDVAVAGTGVRGINQTQDIGDAVVSVDFTLALADGFSPAVGAPTESSINESVVNGTGQSITNFLGPVATPPLVDTNGNMYLTAAGTELDPVLTTIEPGVGGVDYFEITLLNPPAGFFLDGGISNSIRITDFQVAGKLFNDGANIAPVATPDSAATAVDTRVLIDVQANDTDVSDRDPVDPLDPLAENVHGINPQALGIVDGVDILIIETFTTAAGGSVRRVNDTVTGKALLLYTPAPGFSGEDSVDYVIQDTGGLFSAPTAVTLTVEDIQVKHAEFRPQTGKWHIEGTTSNATANTMTVTSGPKAFITGESVLPTSIVTDAEALASLRVAADSIGYHLQLNTLPTSEVTEIHIHVGDAASDGPIIFSLYNSRFDPPITAPLTDTLTVGNLVLQTAAGVSSFSDAVLAVLAGNTYINVHTLDNPTGEIRGQLSLAPLGTATVQPNGSWSLAGRAMILPAVNVPSINITSTNGVDSPGIPVQLR